MGNVRNRTKIEFIKQDYHDKYIAQLTKVTFNGIHIPCEKCDSCTFDQIEALLDKFLHLRFSILKLSRLNMSHKTFMVNLNLASDRKIYNCITRAVIALY